MRLTTHLLLHEIRRHSKHRLHASGVLSSQGSSHACTVASVNSECFQVCLQSKVLDFRREVVAQMRTCMPAPPLESLPAIVRTGGLSSVIILLECIVVSTVLTIA
jgi:hypothetical protein